MRSVSSDEIVWVVPENERPVLAAKYGPVYSGPELARAYAHIGVFATCGDRVTSEAIALGRIPFVGIVDLKTRRDEPIDPAGFSPLASRRHVRVRNPPGMLTEELRQAVREVVSAGGGLIEVDGEEDLGSLALVELSLIHI